MGARPAVLQGHGTVNDRQLQQLPVDESVLDLAEPIKLVIWDLDDTLWQGTLSEGPVTLQPGHFDLVRTLNRRGIVNAICSKNEAEVAKARLDEAGLWDEFVFARIDWTPKGARVAQIVEDAQLRPESVLFIDDSVLNREEVRQAAPGVQVAGPEVIAALLDHPFCRGKDDSELSRLRQYRILEQKLIDRQSSPDSNTDFLRSCDIRVHLIEGSALIDERERLHELVLRTNQLNFTKRRPSGEDFADLLTDPDYRAGAVHVRDRYGDYGICGFYAIRLADGAMVDYLFSCRILNMGVEQWLYDHLGRPPIDVVGDVAAGLEGAVDWLTLEVGSWADLGDAASGSPAVARDVVAGPTRRILMVGGCDLTTAQQFLGGTITTHFSHVGPTGAFIFTGHSETLRQSQRGITAAQKALVDRIPFLDQGVFRSPAVVGADYDVLVYAVLTDYTQGLYRHRDLGLVVPWLHFDRDATDPAMWPRLEVGLASEQIDRAFFEWFAGEFEFLGGISASDFQDNIRWLAATIPPHAQLILLNGAEVPLDNEREPERHLHHRAMNEALDEVVAELPNAAVCDVREIVTSPDDLLTDVRHYRRHVYLQMAEQIRSVAAPELHVRRPPPWVRAYRQVYRFAGRRKVELRRWRRRRRERTHTRPA